jgi:uncharacterized protein (DUF1684 family)
MIAHRAFYWFGSSLFLLMMATMVPGCSKKSSTVDPTTYRTEIEQWQKSRAERLQREDGWLTLCGLSWLIEGENRVGTDSTNVVVLPHDKAPAYIGSIFQKNGSFNFQTADGIEVKYKDSVISQIPLHHDQENGIEPTVLKTGSLSFYVIKRGEQFGVRIKDRENPARLNFKGLEYFPIDVKWRIDATYEPYNPPKIIQVASVIGTVDNDTCPGAIAFDIDGQTYHLDAVIEQGDEDQLFIMFNDATNGKETYGNGRQMYTALPGADRHVILDFNKAYNWPCVFTDFATCPIPPRQNTLPIRVEAGEKMYSEHGRTP